MGQLTTPTKKKTKGSCAHCGKKSHHRFIVCRHCEKRVALDPALYRQATVVSYPKSGRTWLSFLLYHYTLTHFRAADLDYGFTYKPELRTQYQELLLRKGKRRRYPIVAFAHGVPRDRSFSVLLRQARTLRARAGLPGALIGTVKRVDGPPARFLRNPMVLLLRDPRKVVVSHYHHLRAQADLVDLSLSAFIRDEQRGLGRILRYMNLWGPVIAEGHPHLTVVRYERLVQDTPGTFNAVLRGLGVDPVSEPAVQRAVEASSFEAIGSQRRRTDRHAACPSGRDRRAAPTLIGRRRLSGSHDYSVAARGVRRIQRLTCRSAKRAESLEGCPLTVNWQVK